ncbi:D-alanyl-D-alanine carboxypeptidase [Streptomyces phaeofaciens]|uniref:D-alanyl-D-alanine carboxypeptidase n=1 Tax=Streptomyces phaeofaciens TaxID=68254 RepID=UPI003570CAEA
MDTATRVFSVRELEIERDTEDSTGSAEGADGETEGAEAATENTEAATEETAEAEGTPGTEGAGKGPEGASEGSGDAESDSDASDDSEGGDDRLRAAVAQWASSAAERAEQAAKKRSETDTADDTGDTQDSEDTEDTEDSDEPAEAADAGEPADADEPADEAPEVSDGDTDDTDEPVTEPEDERPESEPVAKPVTKPAPKWAASDADEAGAENKDDNGDNGDNGGKDGNDDKKEKEDEPEQDARADRSPVDQPTAVFKAPRPKPAVDQPTTMLKLGGATKPAPAADKAKDETEDKVADKAAADDAPKPAPKPEREPEPAPAAERTSRFVALKPLDEPRAPKPAAPAPTPADVTAHVPQIGPERTTQQPLPPKPPLDLLAELTNTPPPPPTPMRTFGRRLKIWTPLVLLLIVAFAIAQAVRPLPANALELTAKDSYTFEGGKTQLPWSDEGQGWIDADGVGTVDSFGKQSPVAIGSVAKTMTSYIILRDHPMKAGEEGPEIEVDATAEKEGGYDVSGDESTLNTVKAGDKLTEKQALSAVLIPSANNIARLLARWDAGSEEAFVKKMNATAKELGMTNTTYTDPSGLKETTVSTAEDQVKLGRAFVQVPALVAISSAASWTDPSGKYWNNYNELPYLIGAIGIKTGSTTAAGGNLLFASRKKVNGQTVTLVGAVLGQHKQKILATVNAVSKTALLAAQDALTSAMIVKKGDVVGYVDDKLGGRTPVVVTKDVPAVGWAGLTVKLSFAAGEVPHTAKAGTQVGTLTVGDGSSSAVKVPVALQSDLAEPGFSDKLTRIG